MVRTAVVFAAAMAPAGLLLIAAGLLNLTWWRSADAARLTAVLAGIEAGDGFEPPAMLRRGGAAVTLIVLGALCLAYAALTPPVSAPPGSPDEC